MPSSTRLPCMDRLGGGITRGWFCRALSAVPGVDRPQDLIDVAERPDDPRLKKRTCGGMAERTGLLHARHGRDGSQVEHDVVARLGAADQRAPVGGGLDRVGAVVDARRR